MRFPRCHRVLFAAVLAAWLALAGAARPQQPSPSPPAPAAPTGPPPKVDRQATQVLERAIKKLESKKGGWVEAALWQQFDLRGLKVAVRGTYLAGPNFHLHVRLQVDLAGTVASHESVCDGTTLWTVLEVRRNDKPLMRRQVDKLDWQKITAALQHARMPRQVQDAVLQTNAFTGAGPLLKTLHKGMTVTGQGKGRWDGHDAVKLTAVWSADTLKSARLDKPPWLYLPDRYEIYLDPVTGWPYRLEGWGKVPSRTEDVLLVQIEFRDPKFHPDLPGDRIAAECTFRPGKDDQITDRTHETVAGLNRYAGQKK